MKTSVPYLRLLPCYHFWLAVHYATVSQTVTATCKKCRKTETFTMQDFEEWGAQGQAMHKPVRV